MPAAGLLPNSMHGRFMRVKVPYTLWASQCDLRDPGGSCGWLDLLSARSFLNSSAHKLPSSTEHVHRTGCLLFRFFGCAFWMFGLPLFRLHPGLDSGLRNGPRSLLTPQCGMLIYAMHNSFTGTNTVLRPGESREGEGRKKSCIFMCTNPEQTLLLSARSSFH